MGVSDKMNESEIKVLQLICESDKNRIRKDILADALHLSEYQFSHVLRSMKKHELIQTDSLYVYLSYNVRAKLIVPVHKKYNLQKLLRNSNYQVLTFLVDGMPISRLISESKLSRATVYRSLKDFEELGIVERTLRLVDDTELKSFAKKATLEKCLQ